MSADDSIFETLACPTPSARAMSTWVWPIALRSCDSATRASVRSSRASMRARTSGGSCCLSSSNGRADSVAASRLSCISGSMHLAKVSLKRLVCHADRPRIELPVARLVAHRQ
jgi:hypothetical protein